MNTNADFVSRVVNNLKALTKDGHISRRFILDIGQNKARFLMSQKLDEMTLFREDGIISFVDCFELEEIPTIKCDVIEFRNCKSVMKSIKKLPEGLFGKNGSGIFSVTSIDGSIVFEYTNVRRFKDLQNIKHKLHQSHYYIVKDGYLYLPESEVEVVNIEMIALKKHEVDDASTCCPTKEVCKSYWEYEFVCPDRFYDLIVRDTLQEVGSIYRTSVEDSNPNLDSNQKGKTDQ
jgi:hypothetical protein